jgi:hypothetical protein
MPEIQEIIKNFNKFYDVSIHRLLIGVALHLKVTEITHCLSMA